MGAREECFVTESLSRLLVQVNDHSATITINRPEVLNALDPVTLRELDDVVGALSRDETVRCLTITGAGDRAFVAGADIRALHALDRDAALELMAYGQAVFDRLAASPKPTIAAINGFTLGGGLELAMACDIRVAADTARFGQPEITLGSIPGWGGTQRLPRLVGVGRARELILTGRIIDAAEAERIGLVSKVVEAGTLAAETQTLAARLASLPPIAIALAKETLDGVTSGFVEGLKLERENVARSFATEDQREGTTAFLEKRQAVFRGR
jgi:enoyl-CoA hydratase